MTEPRRVALVTGGNRGIGYETCRRLGQSGLKVVLAARDKSKGQRASRALSEENLDVEFQELDVTDPLSIDQALRNVDEKFQRLDVLINNAAVAMPGDTTILDADYERLEQTFRTNLYGPVLLCQACVPIMARNGYGRIVNVSSGKGSFSKLTRGTPCYRISKTALNSFTKLLATELEDTNILVNAMTPGWVRTRLGGFKAPRSVQEGVDTIIWLAMIGDEGPRGRFFKDREEFPW